MRRRACLALAALPLAARAEAPAGLTRHEPGSVNAEALLGAALFDLDNQPARLPLKAGRPLIVNFWARWCGPCRQEIPELVSLRERRPGIDVVGLAVENEPAPVRDFARAYEVNYPVLLTRGAGLDVMRALGNAQAGLPFTVMFDARRQLVASRLGVLTRAHLDAAQALLG